MHGNDAMITTFKNSSQIFRTLLKPLFLVKSSLIVMLKILQCFGKGLYCSMREFSSVHSNMIAHSSVLAASISGGG